MLASFDRCGEKIRRIEFQNAKGLAGHSRPSSASTKPVVTGTKPVVRDENTPEFKKCSNLDIITKSLLKHEIGKTLAKQRNKENETTETEL